MRTVCAIPHAHPHDSEQREPQAEQHRAAERERRVRALGVNDDGPAGVVRRVVGDRAECQLQDLFHPPPSVS